MAMEIKHLTSQMHDLSTKAVGVACDAVDEISRLRQENAELKEKFAAMQSEKMQLEDDVAFWKNKYSECKRELDLLKDTNAFYKGD